MSFTVDLSCISQVHYAVLLNWPSHDCSLHMFAVGLHWRACNVIADLVIRHKLFKIACSMAADCTTKWQVKLRLNNLLLSTSQLIRLCMLHLILLQKSKSCLCTYYFTRNKLEPWPSSMHRQRAFFKVIRSADTACSEPSTINPFCCNWFIAVKMLPRFPAMLLRDPAGKESPKANWQTACQEHLLQASIASVLHMQYAIHLPIIVLFLPTLASLGERCETSFAQALSAKLNAAFEDIWQLYAPSGDYSTLVLG